jgi:hypothetical protein
MELKIFHCGISFQTVDSISDKTQREYVSGFVLAQDQTHCARIAQQHWTKAKLEWCDENTWEQTKNTDQSWLNDKL